MGGVAMRYKAGVCAALRRRMRQAASHDKRFADLGWSNRDETADIA
jgi:hypothetical protein